MTEAVPTPVTPAQRPSRVWRVVMIVVAFQLVLIASGMVVFTALGFANETGGGCGFGG